MTESQPGDLAARFDAAKKVLFAAIGTFAETVWPYVAARTAEVFPDAATLWCHGYFNENGDQVLRIQGVKIGAGRIVTIDDAADSLSLALNDLADELDGDLDWVAELTGDDYARWVAVAIPSGDVTWLSDEEAEAALAA